jgi:hypothetical protein
MDGIMVRKKRRDFRPVAILAALLLTSMVASAAAFGAGAVHAEGGHAGGQRAVRRRHRGRSRMDDSGVGSDSIPREGA